MLGRGESRGKEKKVLYRTTSWLSQYDLGEELWRDVIRKKGAPYAPVILLRRFLLRLRWDYFIRHGLDRIAYLDWDLMGKEKREILSRHYSSLNERLHPYFSNPETESRYITTARPGSRLNGSGVNSPGNHQMPGKRKMTSS